MKFGCGTKVKVISSDGRTVSGEVTEIDDIGFKLKVSELEEYFIPWDSEISGECRFQLLSTSESLFLKAA